MNTSLFSLLVNNMEHERKLPRKNNCKDFKNQTNIERKHLDQYFGIPKSDEIREATRNVHFPIIQKRDIISELNEYNTNVKKTVCSAFHITKKLTAGTVNREINTSPKIVGVERKKNIKYEPIYMQKRHSLQIGEDFQNTEEFKHHAAPTIKSVEKPRKLVIEEPKTIQPTAKKSLFVPLPIMTSSDPEATSQGIDTVKSRSSVRDRISYFNKLSIEEVPENYQINSSPKSKSTFLSLLQKGGPEESKAYVRLSQLINKISVVKSAFRNNHHRESSTKKVSSPDYNTPRSCNAHVFKFNTHSLPAPLKRKPSFEKTKPVALSMGKTLNNYGTNPRRHHLMQDLSLVVPVKFRVAEFERQMLTKQ